MFDSFSVLRRNTLPVIFQSEGAECGLACLAMIATYHKIEVDMMSLRERFGISMRGATLNQLIRIASGLNLVARPLRAELKYFEKLQLPCLLHWGFSHFVVLKKVQGGSYIIHDPARGRRDVSTREMSENFTGVVVEFSAISNIPPTLSKKEIRWTSLIAGVSGLKRSVLQILLLAFAIEIITIAGPLFIQLVADKVTISADRQFLLILAGIFTALQLTQGLIGGLRSWAVLYFSTSINLQLLNRAFAHILRLPVDFFEKRHIGDVVSRFESINYIQSTLSTTVIESIVDGVMATTTFAVMIFYSPTLASINAVAVVSYIAVRFLLFAPLRDATAEAVAHGAQQQSYFLETIRGIKSIKLFNRMNERRTKWFNVYVEQINADCRAKNISILLKMSQGLIFGTEKIVVIGIGALLVIENKFTLGMLFAYIAFRDQFSMRLTSLIDKYHEIKLMGVQVSRLSEVLGETTEENGGPRSIDTVIMNGKLEIRGVSFRYAKDDNFILKECTAVFHAGDYVAIIAPSGAGKSTFLKVLLRLLAAESGDIFIDGHNAKNLSYEIYRDAFGVVLQDDELFAGSIAKNISFFDMEADMARIELSAKMAGIREDILAMPMQFHTLVGDMGSVLSGGQKQRILLARALYKMPKILVLDEATSHLDNNNESVVNTAIDSLNLTRIVVAHRTETIQRASRILELVNGNLIEINKQHYLEKLRIAKFDLE